MQAKPLRIPAAWAAEKALDPAASLRRQHFIQLYDQYFSKVYNYTCYRCGDGVIADDLTSQTFERAFTNFEDYRPEIAPFGAWLFTIARNIVSNHLRSERARDQLPLDRCVEQPDHSALPEDRLICDENQIELMHAMARLGERERDVLSLKFGAGLTNRRIARLIGISESHVGVIVYRSLHRLRNLLSDRIEK